MRPRWESARIRRLALLLALSPALVVANGLEPLPLQQRVLDLHRMIAPAVVRVSFLYEDPAGRGVPTKGVFSGFFFSRDGKVLTNVGSKGTVSRAWVEKDGLSFLAEIVGTDPRTNIALLQLVKLPEEFGVIPIEPGGETPPPGSMVFGLSVPLDLEVNSGLGMVSGHESNFADVVFPFTYTRINLPVGNGEGGSPVVDLQGDLVGITVASLPDVRSSYLVPARALPRIIEDLERSGKVAYGELPIEFAERPDPTNTSRLVVVAAVAPDSSAARADVRAGDVVKRLGTSTVRRIHDVRDAIFQARPGQFISLEVERAGKRIPFALPVERHDETAAPPAPEGEVLAPAPAPAPDRPLSPPTRPSAGE